MDTILFMPTKNKLYRMERPKDENDFFTVSFGHIGQPMHSKIYPTIKWNEVYQEKIKLGYIDRSSYCHEDEPETNLKQTSEVPASLIAVLEKLKNISRQMVAENYKSAAVNVTKDMIDEAQHLLEELALEDNLWEFNQKLLHLFSLIPRKMANVISCTARNKSDYHNILVRESDLLQNLIIYPQKNMLTTGIKYRHCTEDEIQKIKNSMDAETKTLFNDAWAVEHEENNIKLNDFINKNQIRSTKLFFHGSRTENWWSILQTGLRTDPVNVVITGKMFGNGIYFAAKAKKSLGYTSIKDSYWSRGKDEMAYLGVYEVAYEPQHLEDWVSEYSNLDETKFNIKYPGKCCIHAHAGEYLMNDEIVVYNGHACTIRFLIEIRKR